MRRTLNDDQLQEDLTRDGVVKIPLLNQKEIKDLIEFNSILHPNEKYNRQMDDSVSYHFTFLDSNAVMKRQVFDKLSAIFLPKIKAIFDNYQPLIINYINKEPGGGAVPVHQDWDFVNEDEFVSASIWVALVDVGEEYGPLQFIKGTNRVFRHIKRSPSIPWFFRSYTHYLKDKWFKPILTKAGDALIFDNGTIHYSEPNMGDYDRLAIQIVVIPKEAQAKHFYMKKKFLGYDIEEMDVNVDFFLDFKFHITEKPDGATQTRKINYKHPRISRRKFDKLLQSYLDASA